MLRQRAEQLAAADRCEEALPRAQRARELDPRDARAALVEGRCLLRLGKYREALAPLTAARDLDPKLPGVSADLAQAHYPPRRDRRRERRARPRRAREPERRAHAALPRPRALAAGQAARGRARVRPRERARPGPYRESRGSTRGAAGRARRTARRPGRRSSARARPIPTRSGDAPRQRELEVLDAPYQRHVWAKLRAGVEHDSNVTLQNDDLPYNPFQVGSFRRSNADEQRGHGRGIRGRGRPRVPARRRAVRGRRGRLQRQRARQRPRARPPVPVARRSGTTGGSPRTPGCGCSRSAATRGSRPIRSWSTAAAPFAVSHALHAIASPVSCSRA